MASNERLDRNVLISGGVYIASGAPLPGRRGARVSPASGPRGSATPAPEAGMPLAADHQVIVDGDAQRLGRGLDLARHLDVVARRLGIARGMVVHLAFQNSNDLELLAKRTVW